MEDRIKKLEEQYNYAKSEHSRDRVFELMKKYKVEINNYEDLSVLYDYSFKGEDVEWIIKYMEGNKHGLAKALASYHSFR